MKYLFSIVVCSLLLTSCAKKKAEEQAQTDDEIIQTFIAQNNLTAIKTESGMYVVVDDEGSGDSCNSTSTVRVSYTGYFTHGTIFDQSPSSGIEFSLTGVIEGWREGIPYFNEDGHGTLLIPSALGYGTSGTTGIPPNSVLIFDVHLLEVL